MAVLTGALTALRTAFNARFPARRKDSDGWIGDRAHAAGTSGHNPDESGGGEFEDADNLDEVRAIDVDKDLLGPGTARAVMWSIIHAILATPADRARLRYVIFNGRIASAASGWTWRAYYGDNAHDEHAHFSGNPINDDDASPWRGVLGSGGTMAGEIADAALKDLSGSNALGKVYLRLLQGTENEKPGAAPLFPHSLKGISERVDALMAGQQLLTAAFNGLADAINQASGDVDAAMLTTVVERAMGDAVASIKAEQRDAVADGLEGGAAAVRADEDA